MRPKFCAQCGDRVVVNCRSPFGYRCTCVKPTLKRFCPDTGRRLDVPPPACLLAVKVEVTYSLRVDVVDGRRMVPPSRTWWR